MGDVRVVDLFAGWGGASLGAEMAGAEVVMAVNHWPLAVEAHAGNHPSADHVCQDLRQMDWSTLPAYDVLLAGPACQGFSVAGQPARSAGGHIKHTHDALRATAWAVVDCIDATNPVAFIVENVKRFREWRLYFAWRASLVAMGYHLEERIVNAAHHGVPQLRERLFIIGTRRPAAIDLPGSRILPPHGKRGVVQGVAPAAPAFGPHIDWADGDWKTIAAMPARYHAARARMKRARAKWGDRCIVHHGWSGHSGLSLDEPLRTITTGDQWVIVDGGRYRSLTIRENARGMGFPDDYAWPERDTRDDAIRGLGNAWAPPVGAALVAQVAAA